MHTDDYSVKWKKSSRELIWNLNFSRELIFHIEELVHEEYVYKYTFLEYSLWNLKRNQ